MLLRTVGCVIDRSANWGAGACCGVLCLGRRAEGRVFEERKCDVMGEVGFVRLVCAIVEDVEEVGIWIWWSPLRSTAVVIMEEEGRGKRRRQINAFTH